MRRRVSELAMVVGGALMASCWVSHTEDGAAIGAPCTTDAECATAICGGGRCTTLCAMDRDCTGGWRCATEAPDPICDCTPSVERCDGDDDDCDGRVDENGAAICGALRACVAGECRCTEEASPDTDEVDLLLVIDNSGSMGEEQASLLAELPRIVRALASGDVDGDGTGDFDPVRSLHVGVVTTDMGVGGHDVPTCDGGTFGAAYGDDGVLVTRADVTRAGCTATHPGIFDFLGGREDPGAFAIDVACVAAVGTRGCGLEQPLDAMLKALSPTTPQSWTTPEYTPPVFVGSSFGHADRENAGFLRDDSVLAALVLTDEEDCSAQNPDVFDPGRAPFSGTDLNLRCFTFPEVTHPIERYVAGVDGHGGLLNLRRRRDRLVFGAIVGVPVETVLDPTTVDYESVLGHPDMQEMVDPAMPTRLRPSCNVPGRGIAFPPRRIVRVAAALEEEGVGVFLGSICQASLGGIVTPILERIGERVSGCE